MLKNIAYHVCNYLSTTLLVISRNLCLDAVLTSIHVCLNNIYTISPRLDLTQILHINVISNKE